MGSSANYRWEVEGQEAENWPLNLARVELLSDLDKKWACHLCRLDSTEIEKKINGDCGHIPLFEGLVCKGQ